MCDISKTDLNLSSWDYSTPAGSDRSWKKRGVISHNLWISENVAPLREGEREEEREGAREGERTGNFYCPRTVVQVHLNLSNN